MLVISVAGLSNKPILAFPELDLVATACEEVQEVVNLAWSKGTSLQSRTSSRMIPCDYHVDMISMKTKELTVRDNRN